MIQDESQRDEWRNGGRWWYFEEWVHLLMIGQHAAHKAGLQSLKEKVSLEISNVFIVMTKLTFELNRTFSKVPHCQLSLGKVYLLRNHHHSSKDSNYFFNLRNGDSTNLKYRTINECSSFMNSPASNQSFTIDHDALGSSLSWMYWYWYKSVQVTESRHWIILIKCCDIQISGPGTQR